MTQKRAVSERPEGRAMRIAGEKYGKRWGADFAKRYAKDMARLIGTYSDAEAAELLEHLRERFWALEHTPDGPSVYDAETRKRGPRR
jgi:hypothetical protein